MFARNNKHHLLIAEVLHCADKHYWHHRSRSVYSGESHIHVHANLELLTGIGQLDKCLCCSCLGINLRINVRYLATKDASRIGVRRDAGTAAHMNLAKILFIDLAYYPPAGKVSYTQNLFVGLDDLTRIDGATGHCTGSRCGYAYFRTDL